MKKLILIIFSIFLILPGTSYGQPSADKKIDSQIDQLKNKVASRVAELKLVEKRGIVGTVESVSDTEITINNLDDKTRIINVDEFTKFSSSEDNTFGISDIKKGSQIAVLGLYNKDSERLLARFIDQTVIPQILYGVVTKRDEKNFTVTLSTEDGTSYVVDIERITKTYDYLDGDLEISGFTKIKTMENALVVGYADPKEKDRLTAGRIITFPGVPKNPRIPVEAQTSTKPTGSPSK